MVPGISEAGGTCTLTVLETGAAASVTGTAGNEVTYCGVMAVDISPGDAASSTFQVKYVSNSMDAESVITPVEPTS